MIVKERFSSAKQAAYYAGLVPRVDISGDTVRYGRIINRGCHSIRRVIVQAAWSLVRCQHGGKIKEFYQRLYLKKGAKKSIIATSRKNDRSSLRNDSNRKTFRFYA
ncbi:transposase, IS116/IS110/IS902 family [Leptospira interrogans str. 2002000621]|nr:transposase, IS116/IS110/IS902 family [Leptospira interrogans str. 2002000621]